MVKTSNKTIAKNTLFLYFRMMFTMAVSLYTSRIILEKLGVEDYGIYQAVGGIVGFLSFIKGALSTGSSRFLTFELGSGDNVRLHRTFSTTLTIHIFVALLMVVVASTIGMWFLHNKLVIPLHRMSAATFVFYMSILTAVFTITQVPYNALIIAHEKMSLYAYVSIVEVLLKLIITFLLSVGCYDKLKLYSFLLFIVQISIMLFYRYYCVRNYREAKYRLIIDRSIIKPIVGFSAWSLFANASIALNSQGILLLLNIFFSPAVVAARAISIQINMTLNQFVNNFRMAANPQIVKMYAAKNHEGSKRLLLASTKYSYFLMLIISLPVYLLARPLLNLWLVKVPAYTVIFLQLIIIQSLFQVFDTSFYMALYAKGQLRENALISPTIGFLSFPIVYLLFKGGSSPVVLSIVFSISYAVLGLIVKPILIVKIANYSFDDILNVFKPCIWVTISSTVVPVLSSIYLNCKTVSGFMLIGSISVLSVAISVYFLGFDPNMRSKILNEIQTFFKKRLQRYHF